MKFVRISLAICCGLGVLLIFNPIASAVNTGSSSYNDPIIRSEFNFSAELNDAGNVEMSWEAYAPNGFNYYKVVRSETNDNPVYPEDGYIKVSSDESFSSYTDTEAPKGTLYYRMCSIASPDRYCSEVVTIVKESDDTNSDDTDVLDEPTTISLAASEANGKAVLNWTIEGSAPKGFKVVKSTNNVNPTYPVMDGDSYAYLNDSTKRSYTDKDVSAGKTYYYRVCKYNGSGVCLVYSNNVSITISGSNNSETSFSDTVDNQFKDSIEYVKEKGIVNGYGDGTYKPERPITRGEFTKILINAAFGKTEINGCIEANGMSEVFPDVSNDHDFASYICIAKTTNIISGYEDGTFKPDRTISFTETAKIVVNTFEIPTQTLEGEWYTKYVLALQTGNYIPQTITSLNQEVNRGEMAELIWRIKEGITTEPSIDLL